MTKFKKVWTFSQLRPEISSPLTITGRGISSDYWQFEDGSVCLALITDPVFCTRKQAVEACFKYHDEIIKGARKGLDERGRLLKKFYSEELHG